MSPGLLHPNIQPFLHTNLACQIVPSFPRAELEMEVVLLATLLLPRWTLPRPRGGTTHGKNGVANKVCVHKS